MRLLTLLMVLLFAVACSKDEPGDEQKGNVNMRLAFTPATISADVGTTVLSIDVDNFSGQPIGPSDVRVLTSAGIHKVGTVHAKSADSFTVELRELTDLADSPVEVTVDIGGTVQTATIEITPGNGKRLVLTPSTTMVSSDDGETELVAELRDDAGNITDGEIVLHSSAGGVTRLLRQGDGSYLATLGGLTRTTDSPVHITATAGELEAETSVQILVGELDHFQIDDIPGPQIVGTPFTVRASARDRHGNLRSSFNQVVNQVRSTQGNDVSPGFTDQFVHGILEQDFFMTAHAVDGLRFVIDEGGGKRGESNEFVVMPVSANRIELFAAQGYNLIVAADGCKSPSVSNESDCVDPGQSSRIEINLIRYEENGSRSVPIGLQKDDISVTLQDANQNRFTEVFPDCSGPCLGQVEEDSNGVYFVNVFNLRSQSASPYRIRVRYGTLIEDIEVSVVPGEVTNIEFSSIPAQRYNESGTDQFRFRTTLTAEDSSGNRTLAFQESVRLYQEVAGTRRFIMHAPPMLFGQVEMLVPILFDDALGSGGNVTLIAEHPALVDSEGNTLSFRSNAIRALPTTSLLTDFISVLPGESRPPIGEMINGGTPSDQVVGEEFTLRIVARNFTGLNIMDFTGRALVRGQGTGVEVIDENCTPPETYDPDNPIPPAPGGLTPTFYSPPFNLFDPLLSAESVCDVRVRVTRVNESANLVINPLGTSTLNLGGTASTAFRILPGIATQLRMSSIATPQIANPPASAQGDTILRIVAQDAYGNRTDDLGSCALELSDEGGYLRYDVADVELVDGIAEIPIWFEAENPPVSTVVTASCWPNLMSESNAVDIIGPDIVGFQIQAPGTKVEAGKPFTFTATACDALGCPAASFNYKVSLRDSTGTLTPELSAQFELGILKDQTAYIYEAAEDVEICIAAAGVESCSAPFNVAVGQLSHFAFDMATFPSTVYVDESQELHVRAIDVGGNVMRGYPMGRLELHDGYQTAQLRLPSGALASSAKVTTTTDSGLLYYCSNQSAATQDCGLPSSVLTVEFDNHSMNNYLMLLRNSGHSGISLPHTFQVRFGPLADVWFGARPCPAPVEDIRAGVFFNTCMVAVDQYGNRKLDFQQPGAPRLPLIDDSGNGNPVEPADVAFSEGVAQEWVATSGSGTLRLAVDDVTGIHPSVTDITIHAAVANGFTTTTELPLAMVSVDEPFSLDLRGYHAPDTNVVDTLFNGSLFVTNSTFSIEPLCGPDDERDCGFLTGDGMVTGNFYGGERTQWFRIRRSANDRIYISDGYGQTITLPIVVMESLDAFDVEVVSTDPDRPGIVAAGENMRIIVTALNENGDPLTAFSDWGDVYGTPVTDQRFFFSNGVMDQQVWPVGEGVNQVLYIEHELADGTWVVGESAPFTIEARHLDALEWSKLPPGWPGYVDHDVELTARDQFGALYFYEGTANYAVGFGYELRPTVSVPFVSGRVNDKIAIDGLAGTTSLNATAQESGGSEVSVSAPVTVSDSTVVSFHYNISEQETNLNLSCTYDMRLNARDGEDGNGATVTNFSGQATIRWSREECLFGICSPVPGNTNGIVITELDGTPMDPPNRTPAFSNGQADFRIRFDEQPSNEANVWLNIYIPDTGIQRWTGEIAPLGTAECPSGDE